MYRRLLPLLLLAVLAATSGALAEARPAPQAQTQQLNFVYLPLTLRTPVPSVFGFEASIGALANASIAEDAQSLGASWVRLNGISWRAVQPTTERTYNWSALADFEDTLNRAVALGLKPMVIVDDYPRWATIIPSSCAAIKDENFADFAAFMSAVVSRYKDRVSYWELGNEPDVDPSLVPVDQVFGCWGSISDPYYGGERYGRMLRAVTPAIKRADPTAQVIFGGLLLDTPNTTAPGRGRPELFLEGALRAGAGNAFDLLAYHAYPSYVPSFPAGFDYDLFPGNPWNALGGWSLGKARFLRETMARYGVSKPLSLNETGLLCTEGICTPSPAFFEAQANHSVRVAVRAAADGVQQVIWYTLEGPGWRSSSLLDENQNPRPVYNAYKTMISRLTPHLGVRSTTAYGAEFESYRFDQSNRVVDVVWSRGGTRTLSLPASRLLVAYNRDGTTLAPGGDGANATFSVGDSPIFIERLP